MDVSRHKSVDTLRGYVRDAEVFRDPAGMGSGRGEDLRLIPRGSTASAEMVTSRCRDT
jgi:hypothetical protein